MNESSIFKVGLFDELDVLYPDSNPEKGEKIYKVSAVSGTFAGVHIMLSDISPGECVSFEVKGPHKQYKFFEMVPVPVEENTGLTGRTELHDKLYNPFTIRKAPFMVYEVLKPMRNILQAKTYGLAVAFRTKVEVNEFEQQCFEIYVTVGNVTQKLMFIVDAYAIVVAPSGKESHAYVNWISFEKIADYHHVVMWSKQWEELVESYFKLARYGRQNTAWLPGQYYFEVNNEGKVILNETKLDKLIEIVDKVGLYWLQGASFSGRKDGDWMATEAETIITQDVIPGKGEQTLFDMGTQLNGYLEKKGFKERWIQSFFDEPLDESSEVYKKGVSILKSTMPNVPILEANRATTTIVGSLDIWCPTVDCYELAKDFYDERIQQGDKVWVYTCLEPTGQYMNRFLDFERIRPVLIGWVASLYPVEGFLHWGGNQYRADPYLQSCIAMNGEEYTQYDISYETELPAGDCGIFYPGFMQALSCTRLEAHRIGFEDLYLIEQLKAKEPAKARDIVQCMARGYKDYETDLKLYRLTKEKLIKALL